ncbi:MAG TPA: PilZ domain-containing protein [Bradyrhizobium sp.]|uniref:PilZ domain-containing protein n=1 Tax=Bradyrhizobium sp. TaxID=376 RepID=UPI002CB9E48F|nr:PilZ domain-containing protein [Bradyrhizobium sp.]HLZ05096.1 PilZ domain-containing protein [Bradyrhizobium sp.]
MTVQERPKVQREPRRQMNGRTAHIMLDRGTKELECSVIDVAPGGARIIADADMDVGDHFALALVATHSRRQRCEVVWRHDKTFGVKFLT